MQFCKATTKAGTPCKLKGLSSGYCHRHDPEKIAQRDARSQEQKRLLTFSIPVHKFSERNGFVEVSKIIQVSDMSEPLRNSLWNAFENNFLWKTDPKATFIWQEEVQRFFDDLWADHLKKPLHEIQGFSVSYRNILASLFFTQFKWYEVYDFLEYTINYLAEPTFVQQINAILERELAGFRFVGGVFVDITNEQEVAMLTEEANDSEFASVSAHLRQALALLSNKKSPDYRNSIKESISAVESLAKLIANKPKATLGDALNIIGSQGTLHPALKKSLLSLYGYTSDEEGIRHAMWNEPDLTAADAKFFLLSCTSFIGYLKSKM